jgi:hypothetical protein
MEENNLQKQESHKTETPPQPESLETQTPVATTQNKKSSIIMLLLVFTLVFIGVAGYFGYQNYLLKNQNNTSLPLSAPTIETTNTPDPITDWKEYNKSFFSFMYPKNIDDTKLIDKSEEFNYLSFPCSQLFIKILNIKPNTVLESLLPPSSEFKDLNKKTINIGSNQIIKFEYYDIVEGVTNENKTISYYMPHNNQVVNFLLYPMKCTNNNQNEGGYTNEVNITNQILSTFKFTDSTSYLPADWKTFQAKSGKITFKYPPLWYPNDNPSYPGGNNVSFFKVGEKADHGFGDHQGNEVFSIEISNDSRKLLSLKKDYYPNAVETIVNGKPAIKTSFNLYLIKISNDLTLNLSTGFVGAESYRDQILSTIKFNE